MKINRTTKRAIAILELVAQQPKGITLNEIAKELKLPTTSAFDIVHTLKQEGMLELDPYSKLYTLGPKVLLIGQQYLKNNDLIQIAKPFMIDLAEKLHKTCFLAKEMDNQVLYINKYEPQNALITMAQIGSRTHMHATALGKALLSTYNNLEEKISKLKLVKLTPNTITDKDRLIEELKIIKQRGYSVDNEELEENMLCIGSPIFDHNNNCVAAISVSSIKRGQTDIDYEGKLVRSVALAISRKLGYHE
ncbi:MAG: IclR family transcriptional regulator [Bacilli bacterium]|mgnify:CR=1 FL=1|nr:IclR family transcriptional regulator [Bacilli bacterium]